MAPLTSTSYANFSALPESQSRTAGVAWTEVHPEVPVVLVLTLRVRKECVLTLRPVSVLPWERTQQVEETNCNMEVRGKGACVAYRYQNEFLYPVRLTVET